MKLLREKLVGPVWSAVEEGAVLAERVAKKLTPPPAEPSVRMPLRTKPVLASDLKLPRVGRACALQGLTWPGVLGSPVDRSLLDPARAARARVDFKQRLRETGGHTAFAPLATIDPRKPVAFFYLGIGENVGDARGIAPLEELGYNVVLVLSDQRHFTDLGNAKQAADGIRQIVAFLDRVNRRFGLPNGQGGSLPIIGHSNGGLMGLLAADQLVRGHFPLPISYVGVDAPLAGEPVPDLVRLPGVKQVFERVPGLSAPLKRTVSGWLGATEEDATYGKWGTMPQSSSTMKAVAKVEPGPQLKIDFVSLAGAPDDRKPLRNWLERSDAELEQLYQGLRAGTPVDRIRIGGSRFERDDSVALLLGALEKDTPGSIERLRELAQRSGSFAQFKTGYTAQVQSAVDVFVGPPEDHTDFMVKQQPQFLQVVLRHIAGEDVPLRRIDQAIARFDQAGAAS